MWGPAQREINRVPCRVAVKTSHKDHKDVRKDARNRERERVKRKRILKLEETKRKRGNGVKAWICHQKSGKVKRLKGKDKQETQGLLGGG